MRVEDRLEVIEKELAEIRIALLVPAEPSIVMTYPKLRDLSSAVPRNRLFYVTVTREKNAQEKRAHNGLS